MLENFLVGTATLFGDPFTIGVFIFGVLGGVGVGGGWFWRVRGQ